jgi:hypothetical protein
MKAAHENGLRTLVSDLVLNWHADEQEGDLAAANPEDFKRLIRAAHVVADEAGHSLERWVGAGRHAGLSWADVGDALGVSRQAAQQRFTNDAGRVGADPQGPGDTVNLITRTGLTAFNEVAAMQEEGRNCNELVAGDYFKLFFAPRDRAWENIRVTAFRSPAVISAYEKDGWKYAFTWYPFHYFTRPARGTLEPTD